MYIHRLAENKLLSWTKTPKILLLLGGRQTGKTTLIKEVLKSFKTTCLNLDIEIDKQKLFNAIPLAPLQAIESLGYPDILVIDEAQRLPKISQVVKGWYDSGVFTQTILSGSSSLNILDQSAESLTGRNIKIFLPPLVFSEIISSQSWYQPAINLKKTSAFSGQIFSLLLSSITFGNYPEVVTRLNKIEYLNNLVSDFLLKDIFQLGLVKSPEALRRLLLLLAYQLGSIVSTNELAKNLEVSRSTVDRYLDLLEQTFVIFRLPAFNTNPRKEIAKSQKIFFWDTGVRNALIGELNPHPLRSDIGQLWENWVVSEFAKINLLDGNMSKLYFWRSRTGSEVDLVIKHIDGTLKAYEIKWSASNPRAKAFTGLYKIPIKTVNQRNFIQYFV